MEGIDVLTRLCLSRSLANVNEEEAWSISTFSSAYRIQYDFLHPGGKGEVTITYNIS